MTEDEWLDECKRRINSVADIAPDAEEILGLLLMDSAIWRRVEELLEPTPKPAKPTKKRRRPPRVSRSKLRALDRARQRWEAAASSRKSMGKVLKAKHLLKHLAGKFEWATTRTSMGSTVPVSPKYLAELLLQAERQDAAERTRTMMRVAAQLGKKPYAARRPAPLVAEYFARQELLRLLRLTEK
jgi:hypothetical protein